MSLNRQTQEEIVLEHLCTNPKGITQLEAIGVYKIMNLPTRIFYLRQKGHNIKSVWKKDARDTVYVRYVLEPPTAGK